MADPQSPSRNRAPASRADQPDGGDTAAAGAAAMVRLLRVMARLRGPEGCPWDREQDHRTLLPYLIEEAYELVEAVEGSAGDDALRDELGDVLLQVVFHARMAEERGAFAFAAVADGLADKLEQRHPHVFGTERVDSAEDVSRLWHDRKTAARESALEGVPPRLPALARAAKLAARAAREGFEWRHTGEIYAKAAEELHEIREAAERAEQGGPAEHEALETEFGDLLFAQVQLARWLGVDPEAALRRSSRKFARRFRWMEGRLRNQGRRPRDATLDEWEALWVEAKAATDEP